MFGLGTKIISPIPEEIKQEVKPKKSMLSQAVDKGVSVLERYMPSYSKTVRFNEKYPTPTASPTPMPTQTENDYTENDYKMAIEEGFKNWGSPPAATLSAEYAKAPISGGDIYKKHPFLLPAQSLAETSGGLKQKFANNPQNWGIVPQAKGDYTPSSPAQVINDAMSGIGGTRTLDTHTPTQVNTQDYYKKFRETGDLMDLARTYAPPGENDTEKYARDLQLIMDVFMSKMKKKK